METGVRTLLNYWLYTGHTHAAADVQEQERGQKGFLMVLQVATFLLLFGELLKSPFLSLFLLKTTLTTIHTLIPSGLSGSMCVWVYLVPRAQSAQRMETGEGREADWLSHPLQREREKKRDRDRERAGRQDMDGR